MRRKLPWFEVALSVVFLSAYIFAACSDAYNLPNRWFIRDDAYYYFKVAQNISQGLGSTFDGIHSTNGYHPLWMLICVPIFALARFDLILPLRVLVVVTGVLQLGTALLLYWLVRRALSTPIAMLVAAYWVFDTYILVFLYKTGVESSIALFFIVLLLTLTYRFERTWRSRKPTTADLAVLGVVATLVAFSRLDLIFFAVIMGIWIVLRQSAARTMLPLDLLAIVVSTLLAFLARLGPAHYYDAAEPAVIMIVLGLCIKVPVFYLAGLYKHPSTWRLWPFLVRSALAVAVGSAVLSAAMLLGGALGLVAPFPRPALLFDAVVCLVLILLTRLAVYLLGTRERQGPAIEPLAELRANWATWLREGGVYYGILGGSLALYLIWNKLAFGSPSPVSGEIKRWWGSFLTSVYGGPAQTWLAFFGLDTYGGFNSWNPFSSWLREQSNQLLYPGVPTNAKDPAWQLSFAIVMAVVLLAVYVISMVRRRKATHFIVNAALIPLFVGSWIQVLSYNATGYASPKEWYWLTQQLLMILVAAWLLQLIHDLLLKHWQATRALTWVAVGGFVIVWGASYWRDAIALYPYGQAPQGAAYADVVPFLEAHTEPGAIIGMTGGGNVGYFLHDRTIVNMDGLINSAEYFRDLKAGTSSDYLYQTGMHYVFANRQILSADPYRGQYAGRLEPLISWGGKDLMRLLPAPSE